LDDGAKAAKHHEANRGARFWASVIALAMRVDGFTPQMSE